MPHSISRDFPKENDPETIRSCEWSGPSGDPLLGLTRDSEKRLKVIETERCPIAPLPGLILERLREGRYGERTLLADTLPDRGFDVAATQLSYSAYHVGLALEPQGLGRDALQVWQDVPGQAQSASVTERPILNKIRQRIA